MVGDIILFIKRIIKQHITCIHDYSYKGKLDFRTGYESCDKCEKLKS